MENTRPESLEETFVIFCTEAMAKLPVLDGFIAIANVEELTDESRLRRLLSTIEDHFARTGDCAIIKE